MDCPGPDAFLKLMYILVYIRLHLYHLIHYYTYLSATEFPSVSGNFKCKNGRQV